MCIVSALLLLLLLFKVDITVLLTLLPYSQVDVTTFVAVTYLNVVTAVAAAKLHLDLLLVHYVIYVIANTVQCNIIVFIFYVAVSAAAAVVTFVPHGLLLLPKFFLSCCKSTN